MHFFFFSILYFFLLQIEKKRKNIGGMVKIEAKEKKNKQDIST